MNRRLLLSGVAALMGLSGSAVGLGVSAAGAAVQRPAVHLVRCPGSVDTLDAGIFVQGISCRQAMANIDATEKAGTGAWCRPGWVATYATTFSGVRLAPGKTLSDCSRLRKGALQIYTFDTEALDG
ncbi:MAG TPA: hypothetical protein VHV57_05400 [Acidimicrobiales bacterium]|jgi:hypothetical protein|nr:hypothetical protein [Acidimicrobiales bacterium]